MTRFERVRARRLAILDSMKQKADTADKVVVEVVTESKEDIAVAEPVLEVKAEEKEDKQIPVEENTATETTEVKVEEKTEITEPAVKINKKKTKSTKKS